MRGRSWPNQNNIRKLNTPWRHPKLVRHGYSALNHVTSASGVVQENLTWIRFWCVFLIQNIKIHTSMPETGASNNPKKLNSFHQKCTIWRLAVTYNREEYQIIHNLRGMCFSDPPVLYLWCDVWCSVVWLFIPYKWIYLSKNLEIIDLVLCSDRRSRSWSDLKNQSHVQKYTLIRFNTNDFLTMMI